MIDESLLANALAQIEKRSASAHASYLAQLEGSSFVLSSELGHSRCRVGQSASGVVTLLVPATSSVGVELGKLVYSPRSHVVLKDARGTSWRDVQGYITCDVESDDEKRVVLGVYAQLADALDSGASASDIPRYVSALREIFSALQRPSLRAEIGLWGELFVMAEAADPLTLAQAWISDEDKVFDFALAGSRLEVKTTAGGSRRHIFSKSQLEQHATTNTVVVSIVTTEVATGVTAFELLDSLQSRLRHNRDLQHRLLQKTVRIAGAAIKSPRPFDADQARGTVSMMPFEDVPQPQLAPGIVDLSWTAQLPSDLRSQDISGNPLAEAFQRVVA